jgi:hypothetical protein
MLKKFQHDTDIAEVFIFDYGLWTAWPPADFSNWHQSFDVLA